MSALQSARMVCDAAGLVDGTTETSPKLDELKTLVQELCIEGGQKMVVFSQWLGMTRMIECMLNEMGVGCVHLHGQVPVSRRGELMDRFRDSEAISVFISTDAGGSGLNLQSASVLVNIDVPWNPAVLEQRNARIHRLGQRRGVQIILLVARNAYEERVLQIVGSKQALFDSVVDPESGEDVIGISKKTIAELVDELNAHAKETGSGQDAAPEIELPESQCSILAPDTEPCSDLDDNEESSADDARIRAGISLLQKRFGTRLLRVLAQDGALIAVLDVVIEEDEVFVDGLALPLPVLVIDPRTEISLQRLGRASTPVYAQECSPSTPVDAAVVPDWRAKALARVDAARVLLEQNVEVGVMELLESALATLFSQNHTSPQPMRSEELILWLYSEALPQQRLDLQQVSVLTRILNLRQVDSLPRALLEESVREVSVLLERW
jgi:hypothetical protein